MNKITAIGRQCGSSGIKKCAQHYKHYTEQTLRPAVLFRLFLAVAPP